MNTAIYCRISADATGQGLGVERQRAECLARAEREGWTVVAEFTDNDTGASSHSRKARPQYAAMLEQARSGGFGVILSYSNSRLTRRMAELEELISLHEQTSVRIATVVSGDDNLGTSDGRMVARIKASVDASESDRIAERQRAAFKARAAQGQAKRSIRPFGYTADGTELVQAEAELVREGVARLISGDSLFSILKHFQASGLTTTRGNQWSVTGLKQLLTRWRNASVAVYQGKPVSDASWPAIVSRADHELVVKLLSQPRKVYAVDRSSKYLLSHVMVCGKCGGAMRLTSRGQYQCAVAFDTTISQKRADEYVMDRLAHHLAEEGVPTDPRTVTRLREVTDELTRITDDEVALAASKVSMAFKLAAAQDLASQREPLEAELQRLRQANSMSTLAGSVLPSPLKFGQSMGHVATNAQIIREGLLGLPMDDLRKVLRATFAVKLLPVGKAQKWHKAAERIELTPVQPAR